MSVLSKIAFDGYDRGVIQKYTKESLPSSKENMICEELHNTVFASIKERVEKLYKNVEKSISEDKTKRIYTCTCKMGYKDLQCFKDIFLHHFPDFYMHEEKQKGIEIEKNPIFPHFSSYESAEYHLEVSWRSDHPLLLHFSKFTQPFPEDYEANCMRQKLESLWKDIKEGKNSDLDIVCGDTTFHVLKSFIKEVPFFKSMLEDIKGDKVILEETSKEVFEYLLKFNYFGSLLELDSESHFDLLIAIYLLANKYVYEDLQKHMIHLIGRQLSTQANHLEDKFKALYRSGTTHKDNHLVEFALKLLPHFKSEDFNKFIAENFSLDEIKNLIEVARPVVPGKAVSRLEKIVTILSSHNQLVNVTTSAQIQQ